MTAIFSHYPNIRVNGLLLKLEITIVPNSLKSDNRVLPDFKGLIHTYKFKTS